MFILNCLIWAFACPVSITAICTPKPGYLKNYEVILTTISSKGRISNKSSNQEINSQQAYLFINVFHLVSSITEKKTNKNPSGKFFRGCQLFYLWGKKLKSPKIWCFFGHISVTKKDFSTIFYLFLGHTKMLLRF